MKFWIGFYVLLGLLLCWPAIAWGHTDNVPNLLASWGNAQSGFDYNADGTVNSLDYIIDTHPGRPDPTVSPSPTPTANWPTIELTEYITGLSRPVYMGSAPNDPRLFVIEQDGRIRIIKNNQLLAAPFLDVTGLVSCCGERGLLGLAFPPTFANEKVFYVNYTAKTSGTTVIQRYAVSGDPDVASPNTTKQILAIEQPFANHNGGSLEFGPDGYLYIGMGDGGSGGDPQNRAQNPAELLGKMLRIEVGPQIDTYQVPTTNPFFNQQGFRKEIWALGLRNPWKFSFDKSTGDMFIADVGQGDWEEIDFQPRNTGGQNYGWRVMEGTHCFNATTCNQTNLVLPITEYVHSEGNCSVTGGYVYRGTQYPRLQGIYLYGDYCSGRIWGIRRVGNNWQSQLLLDTTHQISSFGQDAQGELYVTNYSTGRVYKVTAR